MSVNYSGRSLFTQSMLHGTRKAFQLVPCFGLPKIRMCRAVSQCAETKLNGILTTSLSETHGSIFISNHFFIAKRAEASYEGPKNVLPRSGVLLTAVSIHLTAEKFELTAIKILGSIVSINNSRL